MKFAVELNFAASIYLFANFLFTLFENQIDIIIIIYIYTSIYRRRGSFKQMPQCESRLWVSDVWISQLEGNPTKIVYLFVQCKYHKIEYSRIKSIILWDVWVHLLYGYVLIECTIWAYTHHVGLRVWNNELKACKNPLEIGCVSERTM